MKVQLLAFSEVVGWILHIHTKIKMVAVHQDESIHFYNLKGRQT